MALNKNHRKPIIRMLFIGLLVALSGCYNLKTIPVNSIGESEYNRHILQIHAGDSVWNISKFRISENELTGQINKYYVNPYSSKVAHIYVAPESAVKSDRNSLTIPIENIGKADYFKPDWWQISAVNFPLVLTLFFILIVNAK